MLCRVSPNLYPQGLNLSVSNSVLGRQYGNLEILKILCIIHWNNCPIKQKNINKIDMFEK